MLSEKKKKQLARLHSLKRSTLWKKRISDSLKGKKKRPWTEESKKKKSDMMKKMGIKPPSRKGIKISDELRRKYSLSRKKGKFSHLWRGGVSDKNTKIRGSIEYKIWRRSVFERDDYTCIWCGTRSGNGKAVVLHADHIKSYKTILPISRTKICNRQWSDTLQGMP